MTWRMVPSLPAASIAWRMMQHRVGVAGVEQFLGGIELLAAFLEDFRGALLDDVLAEFLGLVGLGPVGDVVLEVHLGAGLDEELFE